MKGNFHELINKSTPVLVDFYADWCGPCHAIQPIIKKVSGDLAGKAKVIKVDVDKNQKVAMKYNIRSIPTLIIFKNGKIKWRHSGTIDDKMLKKAIESVI